MSSDSAGSPTFAEQSWSNPFPEYMPLHDLFHEIVTENRDLIIVVDDMKGRRGTSKTTCCLKLADAMDQTDEGLTWDKVSLSPEEIRNAIATQPLRSGLVLDEAEFGASNRDPMSNVNKALREILSMGRMKQKYLVVNAPLRGFIDSDIQKLADVWIGIWRKGLGLVHFYDYETYSGNNLTPKTQWLPFDDIETNTRLKDIYHRVDREKKKRIDGEGGSGYIATPEHEDILRKEREQARREQRNEVIRAILTNESVQDKGITQAEVADAVGLSQPQIGNILRE